MKKFYIIHGWSGYPEECWFIWLKKELEKKGFEAHVPQMPNADEPKIEEWVGFLSELVKDPDEETFLIGHSIGCQTIMRYLERLDVKIGGVLFVAGFFNLTEEVTLSEDGPIAQPWLETPIDTEKVKENVGKIVSIFSDNDPYVPVSDAKIFEERLGSKVIILNNRGHIGGSDNCPSLQEAFDNLMEMIK